jgi:hypothetical protein
VIFLVPDVELWHIAASAGILFITRYFLHGIWFIDVGVDDGAGSCIPV